MSSVGRYSATAPSVVVSSIAAIGDRAASAQDGTRAPVSGHRAVETPGSRLAPFACGVTAQACLIASRYAARIASLSIRTLATERFRARTHAEDRRPTL
jgi:hypothetical protein